MGQMVAGVSWRWGRSGLSDDVCQRRGRKATSISPPGRVCHSYAGLKTPAYHQGVSIAIQPPGD